MRRVSRGGIVVVLVGVLASQGVPRVGAQEHRGSVPSRRAASASVVPTYHNLGAISSSSTSDGSYYLSGWDNAASASGAGFSWYSLAWPVLPQPIKGFQMGLAGTWITPSDPGTPVATIQHLCDTSPVQGIKNTVQDPASGTFGLQLFQTIEGGLGWWANEEFTSATPKYIVNITSNCYENAVSTPGWGTFGTSPLARNQTAFAQLSNRILMPPDGMTLNPTSTPGYIGTNWSALTFPATGPTSGVATGPNDWTVFLNAANFQGPLGYVVPQFWSQASSANAYQRGLTLDVRPGIAYSLASEWNSIPYFESTDSSGAVYSKIPPLQFPVDANGRTVIGEDFSAYGPGALATPLENALSTGSPLPATINASSVVPLTMSTSSVPVYQDGASVPELSNALTVSTTSSGTGLALTWGASAASSTRSLPQIFERSGGTLSSTLSSPAPAALSAASFPRVTPSTFVYQAPSWWSASPAASPTFTARLSDGSVATYRWYEFVDQPALQ